MEDAPTTDISAPSANILPVTKSVGSVGNQQKLFKMNAEVINNDVQTKTFSADRSSIITNLKLNPWNHKALVNMSTIEIKKSKILNDYNIFEMDAMCIYILHNNFYFSFLLCMNVI